ncbi:MAG TPA: DUF4350 domain-containing protein [Pirellulales bacterium]|jgi:hypothetical protein|nr:DUF4350 domain-containing protein [Pirellulales bacterium]
MKRAWIGVALLATSWLFGLNYYHQADWLCWAALVVVGAALLSGVVERWSGRVESAIALALVLSAIWLAPWPYRAAPLLIAIGLLPAAVGVSHRLTRSTGPGAAVAGSILLAQSLGLMLYEHFTARSHELPAVLTDALTGVSHLLGIESAVDENNIVLHTMRKVHRLGATWELLFDPATFCFLIGGMTLVAIRAWSIAAPDRWLRELTVAAGKLCLVVLAWLPLRAGLFMALFLHRALRTEFDSPLDLMGQFWNPCVNLLFLSGPAFLACRFLRMAGGGKAVASAGGHAMPAPTWRRAAAALAAAAAVALFVAGQFWDPPGARKTGRVAVDERHSNWERTDRAMDTEWYGQMSAYNYYCIYDYLSRFYEMSRVTAPLDDATLDRLDVLIVKTPTSRYEPQEIAAIVRFVERGGGLMLIGEHTDVFHTGEYLNEISRNFGFSFRYDCLFGIDSPFDELYVRPLIAHPIAQRMPPLDFEISCSLDPGTSSGEVVMSATGLWNLPPDYFATNYYPQVFAPNSQQVDARPDARYGAWIQTWATRHGQGRVVAFTDSTQFSNFSTFEPGKPEVMLGMVEWLNRSGGPRWVNPLFDAGAALLALLALGLARRWDGAWLVLTAAGIAGWCAAVVEIRAAHEAELPMPDRARPMTEVTMDRTASAAPLPKGGFIAGRDDGFGIFERNILRLGYFIHRQGAGEAPGGNLLVVLHPDQDVPSSYRDAVTNYVRSGGKLLVIDSPQNVKSTANSLLFPFGLAVDHATNYAGTLAAKDGWPAVPISSACKITGGEPLLSFDGAPPGADKPPVVAAVAKLGQGTATVVGFGSRFTDFNMGVTGELEPDPELRKVYEVEYRLLRRIIDAVAQPSAERSESGKSVPAETKERGGD